MWGKDKSTTAVAVEKIDTLIAANVTIEGNVRFSGGIQVDGEVIGNVIAEGDESSLVRITDKGRVKGEIRGPNVIINGHVIGDVYSTEHVELAAKAIVSGNVHYNLLEMVMGAEVNGSLMHVSDDKSGSKEKSPKVDKAGKPIADIATVAGASASGANGPNKPGITTQ
ncbi:MAG: polymer-forming cytoskeletal protein [Pseudomonadales bacterium]|nr:polymer-forming cytoskeletal protein [Pseudomonadales bacterium]